VNTVDEEGGSFGEVGCNLENGLVHSMCIGEVVRTTQERIVTEKDQGERERGEWTSIKGVKPVATEKQKFFGEIRGEKGRSDESRRGESMEIDLGGARGGDGTD